MASSYNTRFGDSAVCGQPNCAWWELSERSPETHWDFTIMKLFTADVGLTFNILRPEQNGGHFAVDIFKCVLVVCIFFIQVALKFVAKSMTGKPLGVCKVEQAFAWRGFSIFVMFSFCVSFTVGIPSYRIDNCIDTRSLTKLFCG